MVSSLILGLESLLRPFKWTMALVPVLPEQLLDTIEAPFPLLAGITRENFEQVSQQLTPEEQAEFDEHYGNEEDLMFEEEDLPSNEDEELEEEEEAAEEE